MNRMWNRYALAALVVAVVLAAPIVLLQLQPAFSRAADKVEAKPVTGAHFTVVETEGHNLLVTDNSTNTLYFYTVDKGEPVGSELKLRGTVDLNDIGKPSIKPKAINIQK